MPLYPDCNLRCMTVAQGHRSALQTSRAATLSFRSLDRSVAHRATEARSSGIHLLRSRGHLLPASNEIRNGNVLCVRGAISLPKALLEVAGDGPPTFSTNMIVQMQEIDSALPRKPSRFRTRARCARAASSTPMWPPVRLWHIFSELPSLLVCNEANRHADHDCLRLGPFPAATWSLTSWPQKS